MKARLPSEWESFLDSKVFNLNLFYKSLNVFLNRFDFIIPDTQKIFAVFNYVKPENVTCVLFGEDPYPRHSSACGIAFWDKEINKWEDKTNGNSLKNILKALLASQGKATYNTPITECRQIALATTFKSPPQLFELWLNQGILLVNSALTFSGSSDKKIHLEFWQAFHIRLIQALNSRSESPYYILWGNKAQSWTSAIHDSIDDKNKIISQGHPTFIHQFMDKNNPSKSPFSEIITKTQLQWA